MEHLFKTSEDGVRIIHDDDGSIGPAKCGFDYEGVEGHGWLQTDRDNVIDSIESQDNKKLCEDCYVGEVLIRNYNK